MSTKRSTPGSSSPSTSSSLGAASLALAALLAGCAGSRVPQPTAKHVELAGRNGQVTSLAALKVGRSLYIGRCGSCHSLKEPGYLAPGEWPEMVERMAENAEINPDQERAITQYLVGVSAALAEGVPAAPDSSGPPAP